ncbi:uncharacterized protein LOC113373839 [Ctenocephalides felis]|uniref:uncharacterized protein LOC113373839 n=1 Tax=Ctenocephalides felis TaxID=7515 RepID=UPI000E6E1FCC|nr:uncharacterized protein LOC113373839 [Ctenocephalides felis]
MDSNTSETTSILSETHQSVRTPDSESHNTSAVLDYCKCKLLLPYACILGLMGLRPMSIERSATWSPTSLLGHTQTAFIGISLLFGYFIQFATCFRRDRGYCLRNNNSSSDILVKSSQWPNDERICNASILFSYVIPGLLHFFGYIYSVIIFRISDNEHLQHLIERVFILSSSPGELTKNPKKILRVLWSFIIFGRNYHSGFIFRPSMFKTILKALVIYTTLCQDAVQATVIACYCIQVQLLKYQLQFLRERLVQRTIQPLDWMREISEFRLLLRHLNEKVSPAIGLFTIVNVSWTCSGLIWLLNYDNIESSKLCHITAHILNVFLWLVITAAPFIQAARLTTTCVSLKSVGHEIVVRPFVHMDTSHEDLHTVLLYTSTLSISAKLFRIPVTPRYLCFIISMASVITLILGMCHFLQFSP